MTVVNLTEAKSRLSELINRAEAGETVEILRRGRLVARLAPPDRTRKPIDIAKLRALTDQMPFQAEPAGEFIRRMRDEDRY